MKVIAELNTLIPNSDLLVITDMDPAERRFIEKAGVLRFNVVIPVEQQNEVVATLPNDPAL